MAFQGDLKTYPLVDLLQWLDASRKPGQLSIAFGEGERRLLLAPGVVAASGATGLSERLARIAARLGAPARSSKDLEPGLLHELAREDLFSAVADQVREGSGSFHYWDEPERDELDDGLDRPVPVDVPLRELLYEALRRVDEGQAALRTVKSDTAAVEAKKPAGEELGALARAVLLATEQPTTVGAVRLAMGLSFPEAARILQELWRSGHVTFEGGGIPRPDPLTKILRAGEKLLAQGQYEAAELLFNSLLASDPSDRRVRGFQRVVEREHTEVLYRRLLPTSVPRLLIDGTSLARLRPDERLVASLINGKWDVSTLVLASPLRELQSLRALDRMASMGFVGL